MNRSHSNPVTRRALSAQVVAVFVIALGLSAVNSVSRRANASTADAVCPYIGTGLVTTAADGPVTGPNAARFVGPQSVAVDATGRIFVSDGNASSSKIRQISGGQVTTLPILAGDPTVRSLVIDRARNVIYGGGFNFVWRWQIDSPAAVVIAGQTNSFGVAAPGSLARTSPLGRYINGLSVAPDGSLLVGEAHADTPQSGGRLFRLTTPWDPAADSTRTLNLVAGSGALGNAVAGPATASPLGNLGAVTIRPDGRIVMRDGLTVVEISLGGVLSVLNVSNLQSTETAGTLGGGGTIDVATANILTQGLVAHPTLPKVVSFGGYSSLLQGINNLTPPYTLSTEVGTGAVGYVDGDASTAEFAIEEPAGAVAFGPDGAMYVADYGNRRVRKVVGQTVTTVAGVGQSAALLSGSPDTLNLDRLRGMVRDPNTRDLYFATSNHRIYKFAAATQQVTLYAGNGKGRYVGIVPAGDRVRPATSVDIGLPGDMALDSQTGDLYVVSGLAQAIWRISPTGLAEVTDTSNGLGAVVVDGALSVDATGRKLYYSNLVTGQLRSLNITAGGLSGDTVLAGGGATPLSLTETPALATNLGTLNGVAFASGSLFFSAESGIGRLNLGTGTVTRIAGTYIPGQNQGETAQTVAAPDVVARDTRTYPKSGSLVAGTRGAGAEPLYWADSFGVMRIDADTSKFGADRYRLAIANRLTGKQNDSNLPALGNGGSAQKASVFAVVDIVPAPDGEVVIADSYPLPGIYNQEIRLLATNGCARLRLGQSYQSGVGSAKATGSGVPLDSIPASALPLGLAGYANLTLSSTSLAGTNINGAPLASIPLASIPLASIPLASIPLASIPLASIPLYDPPGGWVQLLQGTTLAGVPTQNLTLQGVLQSSDPLVQSRLQTVNLSKINLVNSPLASISISSIALGSTPLASIKLPTANPDAYGGWCDALASIGYSCAALDIRPNSTVLELDLKSVPLASIPLASIPLASIPLASIPLASIPLASIPLASIPLASIPLASIDMVAGPLASIPLASIPLASIQTIVNCPALIACSGPTLKDAFLAGAIRPEATLGQIAAFIPAGTTLGQLAARFPANITFGDLLLALVRRADLPWESIPLARLNLPAIGPITTANLVDVTATFTAQADRPNEPLVLTAELPPGFVSRPSELFPTKNGGLALAHTRVVAPPASGRGETVTFTFPAAEFVGPTRVIVPLRIKAGAASGVATTTWKLSPTNLNASDVVASSFTVVTEANEPNDLPVGVQLPPSLPELAPDTLMTGTFPAGDANDSFQVLSKGPKGTRNIFYLSQLTIDADLVVYDTQFQAPLRQGALRNAQTAALAVPIDPQLRTTGNPPDPQPATDIAMAYPDAQIVGRSIKRGTATETIEVVSDGRPGGFIVQAIPYNALTTEDPYLLRLKQVRPPSFDCIAAPTGTGGVLGVAPTSAILAGKSSLILVNRQRLGNIYGVAQVEGPNGVIARLDALAAQTNGVVVPVDSNANVRSAYSAWDGSPCDTDTANGVVRSINSYVDELFPVGPARNALRSITLVGGDDQLPMGRVADDTTLSNEADYASDLVSAGNKATPLSASAAGYSTLTDDPYASFTPATYGARFLYMPDVAIGRLVENPTEILKQINTFLTPSAGLAIGEIDPQTSLVTGYDFLSDGAVELQAGLAPRVPNQATLINESWTRSDLAAQVFPAGQSPAIQSINAHFSHNEALPAAGNTTGDTSDLFTTADVSAAANADRLSRRILMSVGCHSGANVPDVYVGNSTRKLDWPQAFAQQGAVYVANTGYGYGDTKLVAYSEKLHREVALQLRNGTSVADALRFAKQAYLAEGLANVYDPKVLMQTTYYGIPQYRLSGTFVPPTPLTSPPLGIDPTTNLQASAITITATPEERPGPFYVVPGQDPLVADGRPIQPRTDVNITQPGLVAHGAVITGLTSTDRPNFAVQFSRPTVDLAANERPIVPLETAFPTALQNITNFSAPVANGLAAPREQLVMAMGQWVSTSATNPQIGTQRIFSSVSAKVFYQPPSNTDFEPPTILSVESPPVGQAVRFNVAASDNAGAGTIKRVLVLYLDGATWRPLDLVAFGGYFTGTGQSSTANPDYFVQVVDSSGNVAVSSNKARLYTSPSTGGGNPPPVVEPPVVVTNTAPIVSALTMTPTATPGSTAVTVAGSFTDSDSTSWIAKVDFGDGSGTIPLTLNPDKTFSVQKVFTNPGTFTYNATVTITDNQSEAGSNTGPYTFTVSAVVTNNPPTIVAFAVVLTNINGSARLTVAGAFGDPDSTAWTGTVDWGDGVGALPLSILNITRTFSGQTSPTTPGSKTGTVRICDATNGCVTRTFAYNISPPNQQRLTPYVDCYSVNPNKSVTIKFGYNNPNAAAVSIPLGPTNLFIPSPTNRGQPTTFQPGRQQRVFAITLSNVNQTAAWLLDGRIVQFSRNFARC